MRIWKKSYDCINLEIQQTSNGSAANFALNIMVIWHFQAGGYRNGTLGLKGRLEWYVWRFFLAVQTSIFLFDAALMILSFVRLRKAFDTANICLFKVNNRNSKRRCELYSKLTIKTKTTSRTVSLLLTLNLFHTLL